ncbi:cyanase [Arthrobacter sp. H16F315]|uniref:cyanase n=1 Tax=Arthrobacter sp. H16F315 TaxID=2955314 RepID=UPI00406C7D56
MLQVYGSTLKALVHEKFGDGIISRPIAAVPRSGSWMEDHLVERAFLFSRSRSVLRPWR